MGIWRKNSDSHQDEWSRINTIWRKNSPTAQKSWVPINIGWRRNSGGGWSIFYRRETTDFDIAPTMTTNATSLDSSLTINDFVSGSEITLTRGSVKEESGVPDRYKMALYRYISTTNLLDAISPNPQTFLPGSSTSSTYLTNQPSGEKRKITAEEVRGQSYWFRGKVYAENNDQTFYYPVINRLSKLYIPVDNISFTNQTSNSIILNFRAFVRGSFGQWTANTDFMKRIRIEIKKDSDSSVVGKYEAVYNGAIITSGYTDITSSIVIKDVNGNTNSNGAYFSQTLTIDPSYSQTAYIYIYCYDTNETVYSNSFSLQQATVPTAPQDLTISNISFTSATASWSAPASDGGSAITKYQYQLSGSGWIDWSTTSINLTGLLSGVSYTIEVRAVNAIGNGAITSKSFTTSGISAPTGVSASATSSTTASISWNAVSGAQSYGIAVFSGTGGPTGIPYSSVSNATSPQSISGLIASSQFTVYVRAWTGTNNTGTASAWSSGSTFTTQSATTVPGPVQSLSYSSTSTSATVSWSAPASDGGSAIIRYEYNFAGTGWISNGLSTSVTFTGLTPSSNYIVQVRAVNNIGNGSASSVTVTTQAGATVPSAPTSLAISSISSTNALASWAAPSNNGGAPITSYDFYWNPGYTTFAFNTTGTSTSVTGLSAGTTYTFYVRANNSAGAGATASINFTTLGAAPFFPPYFKGGFSPYFPFFPPYFPFFPPYFPFFPPYFPFFPPYFKASGGDPVSPFFPPFFPPYFKNFPNEI